ncbi:MAG: glycosyltransferase family 4 protein, partial [Bradymonadaceae bacterium]
DHRRVTCTAFAAPPNSLRTRFALGRWFDFEGIDLFHSPFNILPADLPVPAVFTLHDIMWLINHRYCTQIWWKKLIDGTFFKTLIPKSVDDAERVLTVSEYSRDAIESWFPEKEGRVHVAYNAVDDVFQPMSAEEGWPLISKYLPRSRFVLVVGQGAPYKNHAGALEGFIEAFEDDPETYFVLIRRSIASGASRLRELMDHPTVGPRIVSLQYVDFEELRAFYSLARTFLFPSLYEGFGLPQLEAMACGTPVVTSITGAPAEVGGDAAVTVDPESPAEIGAALSRLAYDEEFYARRRRRGLERAAEFTWERCARNTLDVYRRTVGAD